MNRNLRFTVSFTSILLLGVLAFTYQTRYLRVLQSRSDSHTAAVSSSAPSVNQFTSQKSSAAMEKQSPPAATVATVDPIADFMEAINEKLVTLIKPEQLAKFFGDKTQLERIATTVKLTDEEHVNVQKRLELFDLTKCSLLLNPNLTPAARANELAQAKQQKDQWLLTQLGKKRSAEVILANQLDENAATEQRALSAVSRMSETLNLSDPQKEQLQAGLVEHDLTPQTQSMLAIRVYGTIQTEPPVPDISEDVEKILTPAQLKIYQTPNVSILQDDKQRNEMAGMINGLLPTLFEEFLKN